MRKSKRLLKPKFGNEFASQIWDWVTRHYEFEAADRIILILFCDTWGDYEGCREAEARAEGKEKVAAATVKWKAFVQLMKMLPMLGMTPMQRQGKPIPTEGVASRGLDGGLPFSADDEEGDL
jgi:phage terminase small subunit